MFIGEGPGRDEDLQGRPFVGRSGELLTRMIRAIGLEREQVYICNVVKCRPPQNRNPEPDEANACLNYLRAQVALVRPRVVVLLGKVACQYTIRDQVFITRDHGRWYEQKGVWFMPTYHPSYLLRDPAKKRAERRLSACTAVHGVEVVYQRVCVPALPSLQNLANLKASLYSLRPSYFSLPVLQFPLRRG